MELHNIARLSPISDSGARVLLFSTRNLNNHVAQGQRYEFEDVIAGADNVDVIAPQRPVERSESRIVRYRNRFLGYQRPPIDGEIRLNKNYDLFVAMIPNRWGLRFLQCIKGLHERCRKFVCLFDELRPEDAARFSHSDLELMRSFDCIFLNVECGVDATKHLTRRLPQFMPFGIDALSFCPYPNNPTRGIDVLSMGRRPAGMHRALLAFAEQDGKFYMYDTVSNFSVIDQREHRSLLSNTIKRSRYFIAYPGKFDDGAPQVMLGNRFYEGAAGGAILLGQGAANTPYERFFDWPDAVLSTPADGSEIVELIADLDGQPARLARIRRDNVINMLLRYDWVYRWRQILETVDLPLSQGILEREGRLRHFAHLVNAESVCAKAVDNSLPRFPHRHPPQPMN